MYMAICLLIIQVKRSNNVFYSLGMLENPSGL